MLEQLSKIKLPKFSFGKKGDDATESDTPADDASKDSKLKSSAKTFFGAKMGKMSVANEEIIGLDIAHDAIRVAQVSRDKNEKWILDKFSYRLLDRELIGEDMFEHKDYVSDEIKLALANAKITTTNIALSIPVTSAIIKVVTSPLMTEEELTNAIETETLWENLVQLTDNLNDYSVFHQVINRSSKTNTMEILFVASKLADVNAFSSIVKKAGLNPVIMDVRCFTLKNAFDNLKLHPESHNSQSAILELGQDENYLMIIHENTPIITDVFLRQQEKVSLSEATETNTPAESESVVRRYAMQIKQALNDYEAKYETKINNIHVISNLKNIEPLIGLFKKNLPNTGFNVFDPLANVSIPAYNQEKTNIDNRSPIASVLGLAFRKLDVFGYYKFVTAVKNINLLPNREAVRQQNKMKFLSGFAFKGLAGSIVGIYLILIVLSIFQINNNSEQLTEFDAIQAEFDKHNSEFSKLVRKKNEMERALNLGKLINSNQKTSYRALAQITRSVPARVQFSKMEFNGSNTLVIEGVAFSDQDILTFIGNLNAKSLIDQASLVSMNVPSEGASSSANKKGFIINCMLKGT